MSNYKKNNDLELAYIWGSYHNELISLRKLISFNEDNNWNRSFVRSLASMIEGIGFRLRQHLLKKYENDLIKLSIEEIILLNEKSVELTENGIIRSKDRFFSFKSMFNFTYRLYAQKHHKEQLITDESFKKGLKILLEVIQIRNRITHPKSGKDVFVSGPEAKLADDAFRWYHSLAFRIFDEDILK